MYADNNQNEPQRNFTHEVAEAVLGAGVDGLCEGLNEVAEEQRRKQKATAGQIAKTGAFYVGCVALGTLAGVAGISGVNALFDLFDSAD